MKSIIGLYVLLWGLGLAFDPRLLQYKFVGAAGLGLLATGWLLIKLDVDWKIHWPWEIVDREIDSRTTTSMVVVFCLLVGFGYGLYYYFHSLRP